ncbi:helix-turn-helix domain-containing protein [Cellulomonas composti]|uniref:Transcriptional regulator n=1 Tax=Cellulomonas composti TaxID=266130 RepID=A0A511J736_9CELL|nr:helix-turn-helix domain-containing protein [Cellulomonas composti]GEL93798.1 transcriptional regulator [Cellulomonas composti]
MTDTTPALDDLVDSWLTLPDVAERIGIDVGKVRRLVQEGRLVAVRRGTPRVVSVPERCLVPVGQTLGNQVLGRPEPASEGEWAVLSSLQGTLTVLTDAGFSSEAAIEWLFTPDESLPGTPIDALRAGHKTEIRRRAQAEL